MEITVNGRSQYEIGSGYRDVEVNFLARQEGCLSLELTAFGTIIPGEPNRWSLARWTGEGWQTLTRVHTLADCRRWIAARAVARVTLD